MSSSIDSNSSFENNNKRNIYLIMFIAMLVFPVVYTAIHSYFNRVNIPALKRQLYSVKPYLSELEHIQNAKVETDLNPLYTPSGHNSLYTYVAYIYYDHDKREIDAHFTFKVDPELTFIQKPRFYAIMLDSKELIKTFVCSDKTKRNEYGYKGVPLSEKEFIDSVLALKENKIPKEIEKRLIKESDVIKFIQDRIYTNRADGESGLDRQGLGDREDFKNRRYQGK